MTGSRYLGNAFLDMVLVGAVFTTFLPVSEIVRGKGLDVRFGVAALITYGAYFIGALRLRVSPLGYLRTLSKRGTLPR